MASTNSGRHSGRPAGWSNRQVTAGYSSWQICGRLLQRKPKQTQRVCRRTLGPDQVPGNLFPAREIYFPGINIPTSQKKIEFRSQIYDLWCIWGVLFLFSFAGFNASNVLDYLLTFY